MIYSMINKDCKAAFLVKLLTSFKECYRIAVKKHFRKTKGEFYKMNILNILREQKEMGLKGNLYHTTQINFEYNTNHIEGSTLTEEQTRYIYETNTLVLEDGKARN